MAKDRPPTPAAVVFDLGGVLIDWNPRYLYRKLIPDEAAREAFLRDVASPDWNGRQDAGRTWAEAVETLIAEHPNKRDLITAYHVRWEEMLGGAFEDTVEIVAELRAARVRLFALSNWSAETFPFALRHYPFLAWFDGLVISGQVGIAKPDRRIFEHLLATHGLTAGSTVFIDDQPANLEAARALGIIGVQFTDAERLRDDLRALGLPVRDAERDPANRIAPHGDPDQGSRVSQ